MQVGLKWDEDILRICV